MITALIILVAILALAALYYRGSIKLKELIHTIERRLNDSSMPAHQRIEGAKYICRNSKGIVPYAMYCVIKAMESINTEKK